MHIDHTHRPWIISTVILLAIATLAYLSYALTATTGPSGGSAVGLLFGVTGYAMMLFAGLLGARKKVPVWRLGRAQTWMRGHIWFGLLSLPFILFHAGFAWKGQLTFILMIIFFIVWLSGIVGAMIQHYLPHLLMSRVPLETIYEEIPHVRKQLREEANQLIHSICGSIPGLPEVPKNTATSGVAIRTAQATAVMVPEIEPADKIKLGETYVFTILPFLDNPEAPNAELADSARSEAIFQAIYRLVPKTVHPMVEDLESICEEERQLTQQKKYYHVLHGWLLVHVPLSIALLVLGGIHAIVALQY